MVVYVLFALMQFFDWAQKNQKIKAYLHYAGAYARGVMNDKQ